MAAPFIDIPEMDGLLNSYSLNTNQPLIYKIPVTYLQNLSSGSMIIDSCSNIILQARNEKHVRVNNKMGIGLDPSSAYSLHVLGDTCISGSIISRTINARDISVGSLDVSVNLNPLVPNKGSIGLSNKLWGNAYINDVSVSSLDVSINLNPLVPNKGSIGLSNKLWGNAYINDVSVASIDVSLNLNPLNPLTGSLGAPNKLWRNAYINDISISSLDVSVNLNPLVSNKGSIGLSNKLWGNAYINDVSVGSLDVSLNLNPLNSLTGSLGAPSKLWRNAYINDVSVASIDVSVNLNPLNPLTGSLGAPNKLWRNAYINDISVASIDVSVNLNPLVPNKGSIGLSNKLWGNAYINDVSVASIDVSVNLNPLVPNKGSIGLSNKLWGNAYINDVSVSSLDVSLNLNPLVPNKGSIGLSNKPWRNAYINDISVSSLDVSVNLNPLKTLMSSLGAPGKLWRNAYINDISVSSLDVSVNLNPLMPLTGSLGAPGKLWRNAYINDISVTNISISGNLNSNTFNDLSSKYYRLESDFNDILKDIIRGTGYCGTITLVNNSIYDISFRVSWNTSSLPLGELYSPNYVSVNSIDGSTNYTIIKSNRLTNRNTLLFLNVKLNTYSFFNERLADYSYVTIKLDNSPVTNISSEFLDNDSKHIIAVNISNFENNENIPINIYYNPLYKGFFGTFRIGNKTSAARFDYSYSYLGISNSNINSGLKTLSGSDFSNILINSNSRLANQNTPLNLYVRPQVGYDICTNPLVANIIGISNNILTSTRLFDNSAIYYNYNILSLSNNLLNGLIGLSFELYKTGFFGTFKLVNDTIDVNLDYSYNYLSISNSNVNSGLKTLSGSDFSNILISSNSRLAFPDSSLNLTLRPQVGYDISANASANGLDSNSTKFSTRLFDNSAIYYNYNIVSLSNNLLNGTLGLSFELYKTGFFGNFRIENNTVDLIFDYSYNYLSISGSNLTTRFNNFNLLIQKSSQLVINVAKFAKNTNIYNTFKAVIATTNEVYYWSGTTISNEFIALQAVTEVVTDLGKVVAIDNAGDYIVSSGKVGDEFFIWGAGSFAGAVIWSTTPPYDYTIIDYPGFPLGQTRSVFTMSIHISGNGQRVFVGSPYYNNIYAFSFSHNELSYPLTQIGGVIGTSGLTNRSSFSSNGFASDNSGNYLITSSYLENEGMGYVILYYFIDSTWLQANEFFGTNNYDNFGYSIDMNCGSGRVCCAGAPNATTPYVNIYERTDNSWNIFQTLTGITDSGFGTSVSFNESGTNLYVTTTNAETYYYTRTNIGEKFTLTSSIPSQESTYPPTGQTISTNSSGNQVILVKYSDSYESIIYYFDYLTTILNGQEFNNSSITSNARLREASTQIEMTIRTSSVADISYTISGGTINNVNSIESSPYIYSNFNILPNINNLVNGTLTLNVLGPPSGWFGELLIYSSSTSESKLTLNNVIRDDTDEELLPTFIFLYAGGETTISVPEATRLANPQTKLKINWTGDNGGISTIENLLGLTLVNYDTGYEAPENVNIIANYTVDSNYISNEDTATYLQLGIKITV